MTNFVRLVFRGLFEVILFINLLLFIIGGGIAGHYLSIGTFLGIVIGLVVGFLVTVIGGGLIATIINIDENLEKLTVLDKSIINLEHSQNIQDTQDIINENVVINKTHIVIKAVQLRNGPDLDSSVIKTLPVGKNLMVLEKGLNYQINNVLAPMVKVQSENNDIGWCFSQYLKEI